MVFIPQAQPHAQSLFLFPLVFGINLYWPPGPFLATQYDKEPGGAGFEARVPTHVALAIHTFTGRCVYG